MQNTAASHLIGMSRPSGKIQPFTHHEILGLIEPFVRSGRHVDLASSDRINRCLMFKPVEHSSEGGRFATIQETLQLENPRQGQYRLTRNLTLPSGLKATLKVEGPHPRDLLAHIKSVPPQRQFRSTADVIIAVSYRMMPTADMVQEGVLQPMQMIFTGGAAHIQGLNLILNDTTVRHYPANIELVPESGYAFELPEDLLAVLGRDWGLLRRRRAGWIGSVRARGSTFDRSRQIETKLERLVAHLTATFARPPAQFHETRVKARWAVAFRRAAPLLSFAALIAGAGSLSFIRIPDGSILRLLIMGTPTMLLFGAFTMREWPVIEFPTFPRRPKTTEWRQPRALPQVR